MKFSAVIVTRGDVDLGPIIAPIVPLADELIIRRGHGGVWERWDAVLEADNELVYVQDDDAIVDVAAMMAGIESWCRAPGEDQEIFCNMPMWKRSEYQDGTALVGWGAFCPKRVVRAAVERYRKWAARNVPAGAACAWDQFLDPIFRRECDRVITGLSPLHLVDVPFSNAPWADGPGRMCSRVHDPVHAAARAEIRKRIEAIRKAAA